MHRRPRGGARARRVERARLRAMLEHGCDLALVCAPDLTVLEAAPSQLDLLDCPAEALVGRSATQWIAPDDVDVLLRLAHDVLRTPWHSARAELRTLGPTGRSCWVEVRVADLVRDPDVGGLLITARDVTGQQTAAQALVASEAGRLDRAGPEQVAGDAALAADLLAALGTDQLSLAYQPVLDLDAGQTVLGLAGERVVGAEALLRWQHPTRGAVPPASFIPFAETHGLVDALGEWTLRQACADASEWPVHLRVAVNLSARQLVGAGIVTAVAEALASSGLAPHRLTLEVTESAVLEQTAEAAAALGAIAALGVDVSLDDFGTGYSSIAHLRLLPISEIKIDRSFVAGLGQDASDEAIVATLVSLASALGVRVVAEGVETPLQRDRLKALGCPCAQGWLWSAALPVERFAQVVRGSAPALQWSEVQAG